MRAVSAAIWTISIIATVALVALFLYRSYYWYDAWRMARYYKDAGIMEPMVEPIELEDGRVGHALTFFGSNGDSIFIQELRRSYIITGGLARIELADSLWFEEVPPDETESALITLTPILMTEGGDRRPLPVMELDIAVPESPLQLISPPAERETVITSIYPLEIQVAPGSTILLNGEDVTDVASFTGLLSANINVYPVGDNKISVLVSTPNHKQARKDIVLYRAPQEINLEPSLSLTKKTSSSTVRITGTMDPTAILTVDTPYVKESIRVEEDGSFSFTAKLEVVGDNTITFRASKPGLTDSVVSVSVYYVPPLNDYARKAWRMDYNELTLYYETWKGRIFLCQGLIVDLIQDGEKQLLIMDVSREEGVQKLVALDNLSALGTPDVGQSYKGYADVTGNHFYNNKYIPRLTCRYLNPYTETSP